MKVRFLHGPSSIESGRRLTRRLIAEHGFGGVAVEGDAAAAARVDSYIRGLGEDPSAEQALAGFVRFPGWIWRNRVVAPMMHHP